MSRSGRALTTKHGQLATRSERHRENIKVGKAIGYLNRVVEGTEEANANRINAAKFLINKVIPTPESPKMVSNGRGPKDVSGLPVHELLTVIEGELA